MSLLLFSLLFLGVRLLILLTSIESVFTLEELYRGTIAYELIHHGQKLPLWDYLADEYSGGSLWVGLMAVPFYKLLGPSLFVLKLVPLLFAFGALIVSHGLLKRHFGMSSARMGSLLFIFCSPAMSGMSLIAMGFHSESIFFTAFVFLCFYEWIFSDNPHPAWLYLFGFFSGLGFSFTYITLLAPAACLIAWGIIQKRFQARNLAVYAIFFLVGAIPWFAFNISHHFMGWQFLTGNLVPAYSLGGGLKNVCYRLAKISLKGCPLSFGFELFLPWKFPVVSYVYFVLILASLGFGARLKDERWLPFGIYAAIFFPIYALSGFDIPSGILMSSRYFIPFQFVALISLAALCAKHVSARRIALALLLLGFAGQMPMLFREPFGSGLRYRGYSYWLLGKEWSFVIPGMPQGLDRVRELTRNWDEESQNDFYRGFIQHGSFENRERMEQDYLSSIGAAGKYRHYLSEKLGRELSWNYPKKIQSHIRFAQKNLHAEDQDYFYSGLASGLYDLPKYERFWKGLDPKFQKWFYFELGQFLYFTDQQKNIRRLHHEMTKLSPEKRKWFERGLGKASTAGWIYYGFDFKSSIENGKISAQELSQREMLWGIGWGLASEWQTDKDRGLVWISRIPYADKAEAVKGFEAWQRWDRPS